MLMKTISTVSHLNKENTTKSIHLLLKSQKSYNAFKEYRKIQLTSPKKYAPSIMYIFTILRKYIK